MTVRRRPVPEVSTSGNCPPWAARPAEHGGRLGSVVSIYNKDGNREETTGGLSLGLLASRAYVEGPYGGAGEDPAGSYMIAARRSTLEPVLAAARSGGADGIPKSFSFYDINAKVNYDASPDNKLSLSFYGGQDFLLVEPQEESQLDNSYGNQTVSADWTHLFGDGIFSTITVTGSRYESTLVSEVGGTKFSRDNGIRDLSLNADVEYTPGETHSIKAGLESSILSFELTNTFDDEEVFDQRLTSQRASVYLQDTYEPTPAWTLEGGIRGTYFSSGNFWRLSSRLSADYNLTSSVQLQAACGRYHQFLTLETSQIFTSLDTWLMSDTGVPPSYGDQVALGVKADLGSGLRLEVEGYGRTIAISSSRIRICSTKPGFRTATASAPATGGPTAWRCCFADGKGGSTALSAARSAARSDGTPTSTRLSPGIRSTTRPTTTAPTA